MKKNIHVGTPKINTNHNKISFTVKFSSHINYLIKCLPNFREANFDFQDKINKICWDDVLSNKDVMDMYSTISLR